MDLYALSTLASSMYHRDAKPDAGASPEIHELDLLRHCIYHLCQIMLHSTAVPLFSGITSSAEILSVQVTANAQMVVKSTIAAAQIFKLRVQDGRDLRTLSPLSAYAAFVTGSVCVLYSRARSHRQIPEGLDMVPSASSEEMAAICQLLRTLKTYWRPVERLV